MDDVVDELCALVDAASDRLTMEVGQLIIERFYSGNVAAWRARRGNDPTFRELVRHPDLPISASAIFRAVSIFEIRHRFRDIETVSELSATHVAAVIGLPADKQLELLRLTAGQQLSTRQLQQLVREHRSIVPVRGGRPSTPVALRAFRRVARALESIQGSTVDHVEMLSVSEREELLGRVENARLICDELSIFLGVPRQCAEPTSWTAVRILESPVRAKETSWSS